jgi:hypothetical protein
MLILLKLGGMSRLILLNSFGQVDYILLQKSGVKKLVPFIEMNFYICLYLCTNINKIILFICFLKFFFKKLNFLLRNIFYQNDQIHLNI